MSKDTTLTMYAAQFQIANEEAWNYYNFASSDGRNDNLEELVQWVNSRKKYHPGYRYRIVRYEEPTVIIERV